VNVVPLNDQSKLRAAIVIEHIMQASNVSHTMQHWHVYQKWNCQLFNEMYATFANGQSKNDPSHGWYKGELWFFDNYIRPLAKKLQTCGVFGVSCDEVLDYAMANRVEWVTKGHDVDAQYVMGIQKNSKDEAFSASKNNVVDSHRHRVANAFDVATVTIVFNAL
jgi:hypothetical protein